MGNSAMEKLANLIDYMQNLNHYLTSRPAFGLLRGASSDGAHHGQNNYIADFVADLLRRWRRAAAAEGQRPDRYIVVEGDTLWSISGRFLQNPGSGQRSEDEPGADQEPQPHLSET
jgi:hypothetical protein